MNFHEIWCCDSIESCQVSLILVCMVCIIDLAQHRDSWQALVYVVTNLQAS
jgi:hypothetical protein